MSSDYSTVTTASMGAILFGLVVGLISLIFGIVIWWKIFSKAGYSGARSLLLFIPIVNLIIIIMLAFSQWPIERELAQLRQMAGRGGPGSPFPSSPQYPAYGQPPQPQYGQPAQYGQPPQYPQR